MATILQVQDRARALAVAGKLLTEITAECDCHPMVAAAAIRWAKDYQQRARS